MEKIPKIIHYIWVGENPKPEIVIKCIESWKKFFPDYKIIEWNENNYNVYKNEYLKSAYQEKKWAFVSDYMRFDILYNYGGIYFDTDVEVLKSFPDKLFEHNAFTGLEGEGRIAPGLVYACRPKDWLSKKMLDSYENEQFSLKEMVTVNNRMSDILVKYGFVKKNQYQEIKGLSIYPYEIFCGYDQSIKEYDIKESTLSVHHYAGTWKKKNLKMKIQQIIKKSIGIESYKKIIQLKRKIIKGK